MPITKMKVTIETNLIKPFINGISKTKIHPSYNRQCLIGCFFLTLMTIRRKKKQKEKGNTMFNQAKK